MWQDVNAGWEHLARCLDTCVHKTFLTLFATSLLAAIPKMCHVPAVLWRRIPPSVSFASPFAVFPPTYAPFVPYKKIPAIVLTSFLSWLSSLQIPSSPSHQCYSLVCLLVSGWQWSKHRPVCLHRNNQPRRLHLMAQKGPQESLLFPQGLMGASQLPTGWELEIWGGRYRWEGMGGEAAWKEHSYISLHWNSP